MADRPAVRRTDRHPGRARRAGRAPPTDGELAAAGALLASARRPLVWAGGGAVRARAELTGLLAASGAGLITSNSGRGSVPEDHPQVVGNFATTPPGAPCSPTPMCCSASAATSGPTRPPTTAWRSPRRTSRSTSTPPPSAGSIRWSTRCTATRRRSWPVCCRTRGPPRRAGRTGSRRCGPRCAPRCTTPHRPPGGDLRRDPCRTSP